jgi:hypothetical protein
MNVIRLTAGGQNVATDVKGNCDSPGLADTGEM